MFHTKNLVTIIQHDALFSLNRQIYLTVASDFNKGLTFMYTQAHRLQTNLIIQQNQLINYMTKDNAVCDRQVTYIFEFH